VIRSRGALVSIVAAVALAAPAAFASGGSQMPDPVDPTIVPGQSLGGVYMGQPIDEARAAWGDRGRCKAADGQQICNFDSRKDGFGALIAVDGKVVSAGLNIGGGKAGYRFRGPLMKFRTEKGDLGFGDKMKRIAKRYPGGEHKNLFLFYEDGTTRMGFFSGQRRTHRITGIQMYDKSAVGG
jgi:hypothetical protein